MVGSKLVTFQHPHTVFKTGLPLLLPSCLNLQTITRVRKVQGWMVRLCVREPHSLVSGAENRVGVNKPGPIPNITWCFQRPCRDTTFSSDETLGQMNCWGWGPHVFL